MLTPNYGSVKSKNYEKAIGKCFHSLHHYCWGLQLVDDAFQDFKNEKFRNSTLHYAIGEFDFGFNVIFNLGFLIVSIICLKKIKEETE